MTWIDRDSGWSLEPAVTSDAEYVIRRFENHGHDPAGRKVALTCYVMYKRLASGNYEPLGQRDTVETCKKMTEGWGL